MTKMFTIKELKKMDPGELAKAQKVLDAAKKSNKPIEFVLLSRKMVAHPSGHLSFGGKGK